MKRSVLPQLFCIIIGFQLCLVIQNCFRNNRVQKKRTVTFKNNVDTISNIRNRPTRPITNIATRGIEEYTQIGYLDGVQSDMMLPLFGRRVYKGASMWNYYAMSNDRFPIKIPIEKESRGCLDEYGCKEIYDGDKVHIAEYNSDFNARVYKRVIRYNPYN
tara:strand:- start:1872 stop:2351 length:480 start_codon:yes stop_codon:yes gene_type:complete